MCLSKIVKKSFLRDIVWILKLVKCDLFQDIQIYCILSYGFSNWLIQVNWLVSILFRSFRNVISPQILWNVIQHIKKDAFQRIELFSKSTCVLWNIFGYFSSSLHGETICQVLEVQFSIFGDFIFFYIRKIYCVVLTFTCWHLRTLLIFAFNFVVNYSHSVLGEPRVTRTSLWSRLNFLKNIKIAIYRFSSEFTSTVLRDIYSHIFVVT